MSDLVLHINDLTVSLPQPSLRKNAFTSCSINIHRGEYVAIVGTSGAGKSLLLKYILQLLPRDKFIKTQGNINLNGTDLYSMPHKCALRYATNYLSMIFQQPDDFFNPLLTIGHQLEESLLFSTSATPRKKYKELIKNALLDAHVCSANGSNLSPDSVCRSYPYQFSGGQLQRLMIASSLLRRPQLLLADEPTTALDVTTQSEIVKLLRELHTTGISLLFVTHNIALASQLAQRIIVMRDGTVIEQGTTQEILRYPKHEYTKQLLNAVPRPKLNVPKSKKQPCALSLLNVAKVYKRQVTRSRWGLVKYIKHRALDIEYMSVARGNIVGIVGESGSGKTTMAQCVARFVEPEHGAINVEGHNILEMSGKTWRMKRRQIQYIFQSPRSAFDPRRAMRTNLMKPPLANGQTVSEVQARLYDLMNVMQLDDSLLDKKVLELSGGELQRLSVARALLMRPTIIIADEITSALDVITQKALINLIKKLNEVWETTWLFITHDLFVAGELCDEIYVMKGGRIIESGSASEVIQCPSNSYTRRLVDSIPPVTWPMHSVTAI